MLEHVANNGFQESPASWFHEASKQNSIYEFIKGPYRIFFFKGDADTIAVCTTHIRKSGNKADKASVRYASEKRKEYTGLGSSLALRHLSVLSYMAVKK